MTTAREQRIADLKATAATYTRVGAANSADRCRANSADRCRAKAARFEAMTEAEYEAHEIAVRDPQLEAAAASMAAAVFARR